MRRFCDTSIVDVEFLFQCYNTAGKKFKPCILSAHVFTVLNGWCTPRRFGKPNMLCPYCDFDLFQDISHLVVCPRFQNVCLTYLRQPHLYLTIDNLIKFRRYGLELETSLVSFCLLYSYISFRAYNFSRHGESLTPRLIAHICKHLSMRCSKSRALIRGLKTNHIDFPGC